MQPQILPISNSSLKSPPSSSFPASSTAGTMLMRSEDDLSSARLLISPQFEDEKEIEAKPLISRASSYSSTATASGSTNFHQKHRRRAASDNSISSLSGSSGGGRGQAFREGVRHAASETYLMTRLCFNLLRYLGVGSRWITRFLALGCYAFLLFPGFIQVGYYYFFSSHVRRGIVYGDQPRNRLDLHLPKNSDGLKPVVAFVTGGAWIIGNFPQGTMSDMVKDASQGISFVCNHIAEYGGDQNRIYLMGQSAGAHVAACALMEQAIKEAREGESTSWSLSQIKAFFGLSGGIMEGEQSLRRFSPEVRIQDPSIRSAVCLLPHVILFHGTGDYSIPSDASKNFANALQRVGVKAESIMYEGRTHTDIFLQDPMRGGKDQMFEDLVAYIHAGDAAALAKDAVAPPRKRLVPEFMLKLARNVSPF